MIICTFTNEKPDISQQSTLITQALRAHFPTHIWREPVPVDLFLGLKGDEKAFWVNEFEHGFIDADPVALPDVCIIYLTDLDSLPSWAIPLRDDLRKRVPNACLVWVTDTEGSATIPHELTPLHDVATNSLVINTSIAEKWSHYYEQHDWPKQLHVLEQIFLEIGTKAENSFLNFVQWLGHIIG